MKKLLLLVAIFTSTYAKSQNTQANHTDSLICKEWKLVSYEEAGKKYPPSPEQKNDRMIFSFNHKVKSIESGSVQNGNWQYDSVKNILTIVDNQTKEKAIMKVVQLSDRECVLEYKDPDGVLLKIYMVPILK